MGKFCLLSPELWPLFDVILCSYIESIFRGGVSCLPAALLLSLDISSFMRVNCPSSVSEHSDTSVNLSGVYPGLPGAFFFLGGGT